MLLMKSRKSLKVLLCMRTKVAGAQHIIVNKRTSTKAPTPRTIGSTKGHGNPTLDHKATNRTKIVLILAIRPILVFNLHHDDVSALVNLTRDEYRHEMVVVLRNVSKKFGVAATRPHIMFAQQPCWHAAKFPFCTNKRRGPNNCIQTERCCLIKKCRQIN